MNAPILAKFINLMFPCARYWRRVVYRKWNMLLLIKHITSQVSDCVYVCVCVAMCVCECECGCVLVCGCGCECVSVGVGVWVWVCVSVWVCISVSPLFSYLITPLNKCWYIYLFSTHLFCPLYHLTLELYFIYRSNEVEIFQT